MTLRIVSWHIFGKELLTMDDLSESSLTAGLVRIYPFCKRLLQSPWHSGTLTGTQRLVLLTSAVSGTMTMSQLSKSIVCSKEQATRAVAPLVQQGYLQRSYDPKNRTRVYIQLTEYGKTQIQQQLEFCTASLRTRFSALDEDRQHRLIDAFHTIYEFLDIPDHQGGHS